MNVVIFLTFNLRCCCNGPVVFCSINVINRSLSNGTQVVFSCLFLRIIKSFRSLSKWSCRNRKAMISFKRFVARALVGSENWLYSGRQISKPFSVSSFLTIALAAPSVICANMYASCLAKVTVDYSVSWFAAHRRPHTSYQRPPFVHSPQSHPSAFWPVACTILHIASAATTSLPICPVHRGRWEEGTV